MATLSKNASASVAVLLLILIVAVMLGGVGLRDGFERISGANIVTGAATFSYCTGQVVCSSLGLAECVVSGCSWSTGACAGGELKACNLFADEISCAGQQGCGWLDNACALSLAG